MPKPITYAIWAAVSTAEQAQPEKYSLTDQVDRCREIAAEKGWREACDPYIVAGESRTIYVNLSDAETAIPQLKALLDDAHARKFDVVCIKEFDRFRDLLFPVVKTLEAYGVQLYSVSQPIEPQPPEQFNPAYSDAGNIMIGINQIASKMAVANLQRKYQSQMPKRIQERGLPQTLPYGYCKPAGRETDRGAVAVQVPEQVANLIRAKDMILSGLSLGHVIRTFNAEGVPGMNGSSLWHAASLAKTLRNPFYCGIVQWRKTRAVSDPREIDAGVKNIPSPERMVEGVGRHEPLWDRETWQRLVRETSRPRTYRGNRTTALTGLLFCEVCGGLLKITYSSDIYRKGIRPGIDDAVWTCDGGRKNGHTRIRHTVVLPLVIAEMRETITSQTNQVSLDTSGIEARMAALSTRKSRLVDAYEIGELELDEYSRRSRDLSAQIDSLGREVEAMKLEAGMATQRGEALEYLQKNIELLEVFIRETDPRVVNHVMRTAIEKIIVSPGKDRVKVVFR